MTRFQGVRLRNGLGWVNPHEGSWRLPPDERDFRAAEDAKPDHALFYVVEVASPSGAVAMLLPGRGRSPGDADDMHCARILRRAEFDVVASVAADAPAAAVGASYGATEDTVAQAACAVGAWKALGGWEEFELMTFLLTHIADEVPTADQSRIPAYTAGWLSVRAPWDENGWTIDVDWPRRRGWPALFEELAREDAPPFAYTLLVDVDRAMVYNDADGHVRGDRMLTRVHACLEPIALHRGARFIQVSGEEFVILLDATFTEARRIAEDPRHRIEALPIPLSHPEVRTPGVVTVSIGVTPMTSAPSLKEQREAAVDAAKRACRNRICTDG
jgi:diguanylate cyclase (GGDEF)-like protein